MNTKLAERNIKLFYIFQLFREPLFWGPIMIIYIHKVSGMSLADIFFMEAVVLILLFVLEIPSGAIADMLGRKRAMIIGYILITLDNLFFSFASSPFMIWTSDIFWVFGFSLVSGADSAFLYDSLFYLKHEKEYMKIQGRSDSYRFALVAVCSIGVGYLADINIRLPVILGTIFIFANLINIMFFFEPPLVKHQKYHWREHIHTMSEGLKLVLNVRKLIWLIAFVVMIQMVTKIWFFTYNMYFELVNLPLIYYGWIFFSLNLVATVVSNRAAWFREKLGEFGSMIMMTSCLAVPILLMSYIVYPISCLLVLLQNVTRGFIKPFIDTEMHDKVKSKNRATAISIKSAGVGVGQFVGLFVFGYILNILDLVLSLKILGWLTVVIGIILLYFFRKQNGKT